MLIEHMYLPSFHYVKWNRIPIYLQYICILSFSMCEFSKSRLTYKLVFSLMWVIKIVYAIFLFFFHLNNNTFWFMHAFFSEQKKTSWGFPNTAYAFWRNNYVIFSSTMSAYSAPTLLKAFWLTCVSGLKGNMFSHCQREEAITKEA